MPHASAPCSNTDTDITWHEFDPNNDTTWPPYGSLVLARGPAGGHFLGYFRHDWECFCSETGRDDEWFRAYPRVSSMEDYQWRALTAYAVILPSIIIDKHTPELR